MDKPAGKIEKFEIDLVRGEGKRVLRDGEPVIVGDDITGMFEQLCLFFELDSRQFTEMAHYVSSKLASQG